MNKKTGCIKCGSGEGMLLRCIRFVLFMSSQYSTRSGAPQAYTLLFHTSCCLAVYSKGKPEGHAWSYVRNA